MKPNGYNILSHTDTRALFLGVEGQLIQTEQLHYEKWREHALKHVFNNEEDFQHFWRTACIDRGDKVVYERLNEKAPNGFPAWEECERENNAYYEKNLFRAVLPKGLFDALDALHKKGVCIIVITHAPEDLARIQFDFIKSKADKAPEDVFLADHILHKRKDGNAYGDAFALLNEEGLKLRPDQVLVLDSNKYLDIASEKYKMRAATLKVDLAEHLKPLEQPESKYPSISWNDIRRAVALKPPIARRPEKGRHP